MSIISKASVKAHFETGDRPTQDEFSDLIDTAVRDSMVAIASAAEGGKTGVIEIKGSTEVSALPVDAFGRQFLSLAATASAHNALGITSVQSIFLASESTASSQSLLGISTHQATFLLSESTASSQSLLGGGTQGIAIFEAVSTASAQDALGVREVTPDTAQVTTSGTAFDFTGIPSWVKKITVMFEGVSLSGTDDILVQIGDSGGLETSGYASTAAAISGSGTGISTSTSGFVIRSNAGTNALSGTMTISLEDPSDGTWIAAFSGKLSATAIAGGGGNKQLSATLDRVRITRTGTDTFDAGSVNILYQ